MYTSGIITIRKRNQIFVTVEDKLCNKTHKNVTVMVKVLIIHAVKAYGGSGDIVPPILNLGTRWGVGGQFHASAALLKMKDPPVMCELRGCVIPRACLDALEYI